MKTLKFKGTPGPWTVSEYGIGTNEHGVKTIRIDQPKINSVNCIEVYANSEGDESILTADAKLISAAPELFEQLRWLYENDFQVDNQRAIEIRQLLQEATKL